MYYLLTRREELPRHFPKGAVGAEIGVAEGDYSALILEHAQPRALHLIDPWSHLESDLLGGAELLDAVSGQAARGEAFGAVPQNAGGDRTYAGVVERFGNDPRVHLHRQYSYKAAASFEDASLDFVYLDGDHRYEFVLRDLIDFAAKLKPGGLLFGHDFFENGFSREENYGVIEAVGAFLKRADFRMLMLTWEPFSTFCLARRLDGFAGHVLQSLLESEVQMIELPDLLACNYRDKAYKRQNGSAKRIPSFINAPQFQLS